MKSVTPQVLESWHDSTGSVGWGISFMIAGTMIVPVMDAIAKFLGDSMAPVQISWGRFLFQFIFMAMAIIPLQGVKALWPKRPLIHVVRGILLAIATTFFFFSLLYLPLANAIAIFFVQPMILTLLSAVFLGERIGWHRKAAVIGGFLGALLIIKPGTDSFTMAALLPMCAAGFFSAYLVITRSVAKVDHPLVMQFASGVGATLFLSLLLLLGMGSDLPQWTPSTPDLAQWAWLAAIGMIAAVGHLLVVIAVNRAPTSLLAPFGYVEIIAATLLGWLVFGDWPDHLSWVGIAVIVISGLYVFMREQRQVRQEAGLLTDSH
ncbi:MAG: DMT family transporter [Granulosicoccus sp.]|nr:DMT family transporter [Granulosicoccus sp.]